MKWFTTVLGIGYLGKGGGTVAALTLCAGWLLVAPGADRLAVETGAVLLLTGVAVWASGKMEPEWGKDSSRIVIDEVAGMTVSLLGFGTTFPRVLAAFVLFRFFDIAKPLFIRRLERLPGGWGVMMDDVLAGLYANLIVHFLIAGKLL